MERKHSLTLLRAQAETQDSYLLITEMKPKPRTGPLLPAPNPSHGPIGPDVGHRSRLRRGLPCARPHLSEAPEYNPAWLTPTNSGCLGPLLLVSSVQRMKCRKGKRERELSHPQLFSQVSLRRIKMLFGPTAQRQNRRWKYLFVSKALAIPGWKAHLDCNLLQPELLPWQPSPQAAAHLLRSWGEKFHHPTGEKKWDPCPNRNGIY